MKETTEVSLTTYELNAAALLDEINALRARAIAAEHHKALSLLGKSSYQEQVEEGLRVQLAEAQVEVAAERQQHAALLGQIKALHAKYAEWRKNSCTCPLCTKCREFADELEAALSSASTQEHEGSEQQHETTKS